MLDLKIIDHKRDAYGSGGTSGDTYSPSEVLEHEFGHSANKINNPEKYKKDVSSPYVIKIINGIKHEPIEALTINVPENFSGKAIELLSRRRGELIKFETRNERSILKFNIPARGLIGLTNNILTATEGEAIMAHRFKAFEPWKGDLVDRVNGTLIAMETGEAIAFAINKLQDRGRFFVNPGEEVYAGQIIGESTREDDIVVNINKKKQLTNMRASGSDDKIFITPAIKFSLEEYMEYIKGDEYVEITPKSLRMRKILLSEVDRKRAKNAGQAN